MNDDEKKIVVLMADATEKAFPRIVNFINLYTGMPKSVEVAQAMLSVVKQNLHLVANVCPDCEGFGEYVSNTGDEPHEVDCNRCKGYGVVSRD